MNNVIQNIYITPYGSLIPIPDEFDGVRINRNGRPDMRTELGKKFSDWAIRQDEAEKSAFAYFGETK